MKSPTLIQQGGGLNCGVQNLLVACVITDIKVGQY